MTNTMATNLSVAMMTERLAPVAGHALTEVADEVSRLFRG